MQIIFAQSVCYFAVVNHHCKANFKFDQSLRLFSWQSAKFWDQLDDHPPIGMRHWTRKTWNATSVWSRLISDEAKFYLQTREFYLQTRVSPPYFLLGRVLISRRRTGSSRKFGFKFPVSGSGPGLSSSMVCAHDNWWTSDLANASLFPGVKCKTELVPSHGASLRWLEDYCIYSTTTPVK